MITRYRNIDEPCALETIVRRVESTLARRRALNTLALFEDEHAFSSHDYWDLVEEEINRAVKNATVGPSKGSHYI
eukprot:TRINITY_DN23812_c0_g1_i1.p1 TRINITY_DN23812_c0_g1~~TRINITY_DN23812_c0_g1_i1.p1  ORF type:complete len:75 (+),score=25.92 TRINITY_DN23812_c0_g1_i1:1-225(+)